jgi:hypothetical protein
VAKNWKIKAFNPVCCGLLIILSWPTKKFLIKRKEPNYCSGHKLRKKNGMDKLTNIQMGSG